MANDILILPDEYVASDGAFETNSSAPGIQILPTLDVNINDVPIVGRPFFSSAYIMVDLDAETWTLWQANATADSRLVSIGGNCTEKPKVNATPSTTPTNIPIASNETDSTTTNSNAASGSAAATDEPAKAISTGAIAGIAVGAAFGAGLLVGAFVVFYLRKRRGVTRSASETDIALTKYGRESEQLTPMWHEKSGVPVSELSASQLYSHELPVHERPSEIPGGAWDARPAELPTMHTPRP